MSEVIEHCETGLLLKSGNVRELALAISKLLKNESLQKQLSDKAHKKINEDFNPLKNAKKIAELFSSISDAE